MTDTPPDPVAIEAASGGQVRIDFGVLRRTEAVLGDVGATLAAQAQAAGDARVGFTSFGLMNAYLGVAIPPFTSNAAELIRTAAGAAQAIEEGVRGMRADFERADADASDGYTRANAELDAAGRLL